MSKGAPAEARLGQAARLLHPGRHLRPSDRGRPRKGAGNLHFSSGAWRSGREHRSAGRQRRGARGERHRGERQDAGPGDGHDGGQQQQPHHHGETGQPAAAAPDAAAEERLVLADVAALVRLGPLGGHRVGQRPVRSGRDRRPHRHGARRGQKRRQRRHALVIRPDSTSMRRIPDCIFMVLVF